MWKPHKGSCPDCPPGIESLITTKSGGRCARHLYEFKRSGKPAKKIISIQGLKDKGYVKQAQELTTDWAAKADTLFSEWIRRRRADVNGYAVCIMCGLKKHWRQMTNGHFKKRRHLSTRFEDKNCEVLCYDCQRESEEHPIMEEKFAAVFVGHYGPEVLEWLEQKKNSMVHLRDADYKQLCEEIKRKIDNL